MLYIIVAFIAVDAGILIGWCLRVGLTRAQSGLLFEDGQRDTNSLIARWN